MKATPSPMSVADYCEAMEKERIVVNRDYQREMGVWTPYARSFFIESILLGYPIPKIFLYTKFDLKTKKTTKEIVDGQQRSHALQMFYRNKLRLSKNIPSAKWREKRYKDLSEEDQEVFLTYDVPIDEFKGVTEDEVRESFTRMNANNISLNPEETLNAKYQGKFKWFIFEISREHREDLLQSGIVSRRDIIRMADTRIFTDLVSILEDGFITTRPPNIESLYKRYDLEFPMAPVYGEKIGHAFKSWHLIDGGNYERLAKKHIFYTFLSALVAKNDPALIVNKLDANHRAELEVIQGIGASLTQLDLALDAERPEEKLSAFVAACSAKTNVGQQKFLRFAYLFSALQQET